MRRYRRAVTTRKLVLVRHAKAARTGKTDIERELAPRGRADAPAVGRWLAAEDLAPDRAVLSPARRATQTWELAAGELPAAPDAAVDDRLYANIVEDLLAVVRETPPGVGTVALVGHNPSIEQLALALDDGTGDAAARHELATKYPTSGVAVFAVTADWTSVAPGAGTLLAFTVPHG
jgi:phosphohistidine phosphatase